MNPFVEDALKRVRESFDGDIYVVRDFETSLVVLVVPPPADPDDDEEHHADWARVTSPQLLVFDPSFTGDEVAH